MDLVSLGLAALTGIIVMIIGLVVRSTPMPKWFEEIVRGAPRSSAKCSTCSGLENSPVDIVCRHDRTFLVVQKNLLIFILGNPWYLATLGSLTALAVVVLHELEFTYGLSALPIHIYSSIVFFLFVGMMLRNYPLMLVYGLVLGILIFAARTIIGFSSFEAGFPNSLFLQATLTIVFLFAVVFSALYRTDSTLLKNPVGKSGEWAFVAGLLAAVVWTLVLMGIETLTGARELTQIYAGIISTGTKSLIAGVLSLGIAEELMVPRRDSEFPVSPQLRRPNFIEKKDLEKNFFANARRQDDPNDTPLARLANRVNNIFVDIAENAIWATFNIIVGTTIVFVELINFFVWLTIRFIFRMFWSVLKAINLSISAIATFVESSVIYGLSSAIPFIAFWLASHFTLLASRNLFAYMYMGDVRMFTGATLQYLFLVAPLLTVLVGSLSRISPREVAGSLLNAIVDRYGASALFVFSISSTALGIARTGPFRIGPLTVASYFAVAGMIVWAQSRRRNVQQMARRLSSHAPFVFVVLLAACILVSLFWIDPRRILGSYDTPTPVLTATPTPTFTATATPTNTFTATPTPTETFTLTPVPTPTPTSSPTPLPSATAVPTSTPTPKYRAVNNGCNGPYGRANYGTSFHTIEGTVYEQHARIANKQIVISEESNFYRPGLVTQTGRDTLIYSAVVPARTWYVWVNEGNQRVSAIGSINIGPNCPHGIMDFQLFGY